MRMQVILDSSFRPLGFSPYMGREERRVQGLDYSLAERTISDNKLDSVLRIKQNPDYYNEYWSVRSNLDDFQCHTLLELDFHFNIIAVTETRIYNDILDFSPNIPNYNF